MVKTLERPWTEGLLLQSHETKTNYFKGITVPHRKLQEALNVLLINILEPADTLIFLVFGVTGVGKTTLRLRLEKMLLEKFLPSLCVNPGQIAVAGIEAIPAEQGKFSYKDYYTRALEALQEVLIKYKIDDRLPSDGSKELGWPNQTYYRDTPALRRAMEKVFRYRQLKAFTIDEAQHLLMMAGAHQMLHQMNWIKSIANLTGTVHILFGTYELLNCPTLNGQMGRRSEDIHLSPYQADNPEDVAEFIRIIITFQRHIPLIQEPKLEQYYEYLFSGSVGCVGILKNWLTRALRVAYSEDARTLKLKHLKIGALEASRLKKIKEEAEQGLYGQASVRALNGTQMGAKQLVKALEALTLRNDLQFLTLLPWAEVLPVLGLLKPSQAWCPDCYQEWLNHKQVIYSPLLWTLQVVKICPYHYRPLESQCPHCHQEFLPLWRNSRPGFCLKCGGWLGTNCELSSQKKNLLSETVTAQQQIWIVQTLGELIAQALMFPSPPVRETIKKIFRAYVDEYTNGNVSAFGRCLGLSRHEILHWCSGVTIPNLDKLLKICYTLETSLVDFLQMKIVPLSPNKRALLSIKEGKKQPRPEQVSSRISHDLEQVIQAMQLALEEEPPPSLTQLALRLGFKSYSSLTTCSKSLSAVLTARYTDYQQQRQLERIRNVLTSALWSDEYPPPSLRKIAQRTGIGLATFYCYCPILCHAISLRYEDYQKFHSKKKIVLGCREVRRLVPELVKLSITPNVKNLRQFMQYPATLWHPEVVEVLNEVRRSLKC